MSTGDELVMNLASLAFRLRGEVNVRSWISPYSRILTPAERIPSHFRQSGIEAYGPSDSTRKEVRESRRVKLNGAAPRG